MHESGPKKVNSKHLWSRCHDATVQQCHSIKNFAISVSCFFLPQRVEIEASEWGEGGPEKGKFQPYPPLKERQHSCEEGGAVSPWGSRHATPKYGVLVE